MNKKKYQELLALAKVGGPEEFEQARIDFFKSILDECPLEFQQRMVDFQKAIDSERTAYKGDPVGYTAVLADHLCGISSVLSSYLQEFEQAVKPITEIGSNY